MGKFIESLTGKSEEDLINDVSIINNDPKKEIFKIIDTLYSKIEERQGEHSDLLIDLQIIKIELTKSFPDLQLVEIKLDNLSKLDYVGPEVQELKDYLLVPAN